MLLSAVSVLVVAQSSSEIPEGLMNNPVYASVMYCQSKWIKRIEIHANISQCIELNCKWN